MTDLTTTIAPKSDQLNSDDLISGPRTVEVEKVRLLGEADQPVAVHYKGDGGKPWKPCKGMRRVLVQIWGGDGSKYAGRRLTLFRDPTVAWGGAAVGGIRISHMSDISEPVTIALTVSRAQRKPFVVKPLKATETKTAPKPDVEDFDHETFVSTVEKVLSLATDAEELNAWWNAETQKDGRKKYALKDAGAAAELRARVAAKIGELSAGGEV